MVSERAALRPAFLSATTAAGPPAFADLFTTNRRRRMALKYTVDTLDGLSPAVRGHYTKADDGKFQLTLDGGHPDTARVAEFRDNNVKLTKERDDLLARFDGIDPAAVKATAAKLAALEQAKPDERIAALESQLAAANKRANEGVLKDAVSGAFLKSGGRPAASDYILSKAEKLFTVAADGTLVSSAFDPDQPGVKLTVAAFINQQLKESSFAFQPSSGSGADPRRSTGGGNRSGAKELRNPTPQQLGDAATAAAIRRGELKVVYDHE
jgi:hypothetical protein